MKSILLVLGIAITILGLIPFIFAYPYNDSPNSGPANYWELIVMAAFEVKGWMIFAGVTISLLSLMLKKRASILSE